MTFSKPINSRHLQSIASGSAKYEERQDRGIAAPNDVAEGLFALLMDPDRPHYSDFLTVSESMMDGYARFIDLGLPRHTIALAMLGGAINLYDMFEMSEELPTLLRSIADRLEKSADPN